MDIIREIEAYILHLWLETGQTPTIDHLIAIFAITEDVFTKDELTALLVEHDEEQP